MKIQPGRNWPTTNMFFYQRKNHKVNQNNLPNNNVKLETKIISS